MGTRAELIVRIIDEQRGKPNQMFAPPLLYDSRAEAEKARGKVVKQKEFSKRDMMRLMQDIRGRHPKPGAAAPYGGILPPARMR